MDRGREGGREQRGSCCVGQCMAGVGLSVSINEASQWSVRWCGVTLFICLAIRSTHSITYHYPSISVPPHTQ